jgi:MFS family permease
MVISDFFFNSAWGLLSPIFALFIAQRITNNNALAAEVAGFAALIYWIIKSIIQIPIGRYLDKNHGERDDFWFMFIGHIITGIVPFGYIISYSSWHIYILQVLYAIGMAMIVPPWMAVLGRHIDKGKEAFEWGLNSTVVGFALGATGAIGGIIAANLGFNMIFIITGSVNMVSALMLLYIYKDLSQGKNIKHFLFPFLPSNRYEKSGNS